MMKEEVIGIIKESKIQSVWWNLAMEEGEFVNFSTIAKITINQIPYFTTWLQITNNSVVIRNKIMYERDVKFSLSGITSFEIRFDDSLNRA